MWKLVILILLITADGEVKTTQSQVKGMDTLAECEQVAERITWMAVENAQQVIRFTCEREGQREG